MYSISYKTKKGGNAVMTSLNFSEIEKKTKLLCKQKQEAIIYKNGIEIGKVFWMDYAYTLSGWDYFLKNE